MQIIPVIDLKGGEVVRAQRGLRHLYAPIETPLAATSRASDIVKGFLALHQFREIYIADLDAIEGRGDHAAEISALESEFSSVTFWINSGLAEASAARAALARHRGDIVLGSETLRETETVSALRTEGRIILSLDFRDGAFQGPAGLDENEALWPARILVMSLARVGSDAGPDFVRLQNFVVNAKGRHEVYAAGGLRDADDLAGLAEAGVAGILVASALHDRRLDAAVLQRYGSY